MTDVVAEIRELAARTAELARRAGADDAEVLVRDGSELSVRVRLGEPELVKEAQSHALGLRVLVDRRAASTYTTDFSPAGLARFAADTVELARLAEPDELNRLPDPEDLSGEIPDLDLWDEALLAVDAGTALGWAREGEAAARACDPRVTNSDGASFMRVAAASAFATTAGFAAGYRATFAFYTVDPVCDDEGGKKRSGTWYTAGRFLEGLDPWEHVGREAARRTVAKLGGHKIDTCEVPVVFDAEVGRSLLSSFFAVVNGASWYRRSSYLIGREGRPCASPLVTIVDDPLIRRGPGSRPFDGDGLASRRNVVVRDGVLETVLCDVYSARKLGRRSTASAGRGVGGASGPTSSNLILQPGATPFARLIGDLDRGFYVTELMGYGFNPVTGDFSRGASGFWIEKGERAFPVSEVTISASFDDLWQRIEAVGDDLDLRTAVASPSFRVSRMMVAGR